MVPLHLHAPHQRGPWQNFSKKHANAQNQWQLIIASAGARRRPIQRLA